MHRYASSTPDARELVAELVFVWDQIKSNPPSDSSSRSFPHNRSSQSSPSSGQERVIYPIMSEHGTRNPQNRRHQPMRVLSPTSEPIEDEGGPGVNLKEEEDVEEEARERFMDAKDSLLSDEEHIETSHSSGAEDPNPQRQKNKADGGGGGGGVGGGGGAKGLIAPLVEYIKGGGESAEERWHKRIESALIKMNTEMAALREQIEMQQEVATSRSGILGSFGRKKRVGWFSWLLELTYTASVAIARHILINAALLAAISLFMRYRGIPLERLEHIASSWIRRVQHLTFVRRLGRITEHQARSLGIRPARASSSMI